MRRRIEGPSFSPAEAVTDPIPVHEGWDDDFYFEYNVFDDHGAGYNGAYPPTGPWTTTCRRSTMPGSRHRPTQVRTGTGAGRPGPQRFSSRGGSDGCADLVDVEESHGRHRLSDGTAPHRPRHYREDDEGADDDAETYGRHALAGRSRLSGADLALPLTAVFGIGSADAGLHCCPERTEGQQHEPVSPHPWNPSGLERRDVSASRYRGPGGGRYDGVRHLDHHARRAGVRPPKPASSAASAPATPAAAHGVEGTLADVPWSKVGPGWALAMWSPATPHRPGEQQAPANRPARTRAARCSWSTPPVTATPSPRSHRAPTWIWSTGRVTAATRCSPRRRHPIVGALGGSAHRRADRAVRRRPAAIHPAQRHRAADLDPLQRRRARHPETG